MSGYTFPIIGPNRVSSGVGARSSPGGIGSTNHRGIDIAAPGGSPVVAPTDLRITGAGARGGYGNLVTGIDAYGNEYRFAHLKGFGVSPGDMISQGGILGAVGSTGNSTGNHLHFEIRDKAGKLLTNAMETVLGKGKQIAGGALEGLLKSNPFTAPFSGVTDALGITGDGCGVNPICHLEKWLEETGFVQRFALFIVAMVLIIGGITFLAKGYNPLETARKALT